jgi:hypothetical protein
VREFWERRGNSAKTRQADFFGKRRESTKNRDRKELEEEQSL